MSASNAPAVSPYRVRWTVVQEVAAGISVVLLIVGVVGWSGHWSVAVGAAGVLLARWYDGARGFLLIGGLLYAAVWLFRADNWLHLALAVVMLFSAWAFARSGPAARPMGGLSTGVLVRKG